jgi:hypothetical protein
MDDREAAMTATANDFEAAMADLNDQISLLEAASYEKGLVLFLSCFTTRRLGSKCEQGT